MKNTSSLLLYHDLIESIVAALEARDPYTSDHSMRVAEISEQLCILLNLSEEEITTIHIAAHVHDIGKIGIDDALLRKEGALITSEWKKMKEHTVIGYTILNKIKSFSEIAEMVRHHHERWDGKGYPDGISTTQIPLGSRIIAVADSIDTMMSNRSYRNGLSSERCRQEIQKNLGVMYDPFIAHIVLQNWEKVVENNNFIIRHKLEYDN